MKIRDLKTLLNVFSDDAFVGKYVLNGKPYVVIVTDYGNDIDVPLPWIDLFSSKSMLDQLKESK